MKIESHNTATPALSDSGGDGANSSGGDRDITIYYVSEQDAQALFQATEAIGAVFSRASPSEQRKIAKLVASHVRLTAPDLAKSVASALENRPIYLLRGVRVDGDGAQLCATVLSLLRGGEVFQYTEQLDGELTAPIEPKPDGAPNSNSSPEPFGFHTDDAVLPPEFRVEEIALLSVHNPAGTLTGFAFLGDIL